MTETVHRRRKVLLLLPRKLFPLVSGYSLKNYHLIKLLSKRYEIRVFLVSNDALDSEEEEFYQTNTKSFEQFGISRGQRAAGVLCALCGGRPAQTGLFFSRALAGRIKEVSADVDIIIYELIRMMPYADYCCKEKIQVFDMADSLGLHYKNSVRGTRSLFLKCYYRFEYGRLLRYEEESIRRCDATFLFNREEYLYWKRYGKVQWIPHGVKQELFTYEKRAGTAGDYVAFIGKMDYRPNIDAVIWYVENIHARMKEPPDFLIVGASPAKQVLRLQKREGVKVLGYMEEPYALLKSALAVVAPVQTGGGIQNKVLEAMALGRAVLLSSRAASPIVGARDGKEFLICDTLGEYERNFFRLRENPRLAEELGGNARNFIQKFYTWERYENVYSKVLEQLQGRQGDERGRSAGSSGETIVSDRARL